MKFQDSKIILSPTDASIFSNCKYASYLDLKVLNGKIIEKDSDDNLNILVQRAGIEHEKLFEFFKV